MDRKAFMRGFWSGLQTTSLAALCVTLMVCAGVGFITTVDLLAGKTPAVCIKGGQHGPDN